MKTGCALIACLIAVAPAWAQERAEDPAPRRTRVALGPQLVPRFPGASGHVVRPFLDISRARGAADFRFEAPDESSGIAVYDRDGISFGPGFAFEGRRSRRDTDGFLPRVGFTVELGGFVQAFVTDEVRLRIEARHGVTGHGGLIANVGADYVAREGDRRVLSIGPRLTFADGRQQRAFFGVRPEDAAPGLPAYRPGAGLQAVGVAAGGIQSLGGRWSLHGYAKYDRLVGDAGDSPVAARFGDRNQLSGGLALGYTFGC